MSREAGLKHESSLEAPPFPLSSRAKPRDDKGDACDSSEEGLVTGNSRSDNLGVAKEGFEAVVHVLLYVAVEKRQPGLVSYEVNHGAAVIRNDYRVF